MTVANPYVPTPPSMRSWETVDPMPPQASPFERHETVEFSSRLGARILDILFLAVIGAFSLVVTISVMLWTARSGEDHSTGLGRYPAHLLGILNALSFYGICEAFAGASPGKLLCGMRVVQLDGKPCSLAKAYIRQALFFVDVICFGLVGYLVMSQSPYNQRLGDRVAGTMVVYKRALEARRLPSASSIGEVVVGIVAATAACSAMTAVSIWLLTL
ncbi:MAG: RDD family protein [Polyangiaceae bacterium]|nr:RDD family protein [Polyangiaceae bacterium]